MVYHVFIGLRLLLGISGIADLELLMKILITGGGGFLGSHIAKRLLEHNHTISIYNRNRYPELEQLGIRNIIGDIRNPIDVTSACRNMDAVIHTAAKAGVWGSMEDFYRINYVGTFNVLNACKYQKVSKLIYTSSPSVIYDGNSLENVDESYPYPSKFNCYYPETKAKAEELILASNGKDGVYTIALRPHLIWGAGDPHLIPRIIERAKKGQLVQVGDGTNKVDLTYIDNAAYAHILALEKLSAGSSIAGKAYFITDDEPIVLWDWINNLLFKLGLEPVKKKIGYKTARVIGSISEFIYKLFHLPGEPKMTRFVADQLATSHYFNIDNAKKELGYKPIVSSEVGLERLLAWLQE